MLVFRGGILKLQAKRKKHHTFLEAVGPLFGGLEICRRRPFLILGSRLDNLKEIYTFPTKKSRICRTPLKRNHFKRQVSSEPTINFQGIC